MVIKSKDYRDYVIKNGKFIGKFEEMYQNIEDPWHHGDATVIQYDLALYLIDKYKICSKRGKIFDIGCAKGAFTSRIKKLRPMAQILAVDIAPTAIKKAKKKYGYLGIDFKAMDILKEYKNLNEKFDLIVMSQLMWYVLPKFEEIVNYLIKKVLKNDGYLLINQAFYKPEEQKYGKEIVQTPKDMINLIGLESVEMIEINRFRAHNVIALFNKKLK
jgi:SAM-dependent methyltransferase